MEIEQGTRDADVRAMLRWPEPLRREVLPPAVPPKLPARPDALIGALIVVLSLIGLVNVLIGMGR